MGKSNGRSEVEKNNLDTEPDLPAADPNDGAEQGSPVFEAELLKLKAERDSLLDRLARTQAEFENVRRRNIKEQQDFRDYAASDTIKALLPVLDSFQRALETKSEPADFRNGVDLIYKQLMNVLMKMSLQPIEARGEVFNPHLHEAIEMVETDEAPDHEVIEELQRGYKLKDRLLRPAMVKVAKNRGR